MKAFNIHITSAILFCCVLLVAATACAGCTDYPISIPASVDSAVTVPEEPVPAIDDPTTSGIPVAVSDTTVSSSYGKATLRSAPTVTQGGYITFTLTAPYGDYHVVVSSSGIIPDGQINVDTQTPPYTQNFAKVHVDASGRQTFTVKAVGRDDITISLVE